MSISLQVSESLQSLLTAVTVPGCIGSASVSIALQCPPVPANGKLARLPQGWTERRSAELLHWAVGPVTGGKVPAVRVMGAAFRCLGTKRYCHVPAAPGATVSAVPPSVELAAPIAAGSARYKCVFHDSDTAPGMDPSAGSAFHVAQVNAGTDPENWPQIAASVASDADPPSRTERARRPRIGPQGAAPQPDARRLPPCRWQTVQPDEESTKRPRGQEPFG